MSRSLKLYIAGLVAVGALALLVTSLVFPIHDAIGLEFDGVAGISELEKLTGLGFWIVASLFASALPVQMPRGILVGVAIAPIVAAMNLGGPAAAVWVSLIGLTEVREIRGRIPWYGTLSNHAGVMIPAAIAGVVLEGLRVVTSGGPADLIATLIASLVYFALNLVLVSGLVTLRLGGQFRTILVGDARVFATNLVALTPLGWLMARMYTTEGLGWWATLLFALPLYTTRMVYHRLMEMRVMFTQTIEALAGAVDNRDPYTGEHSRRVKRIAVDIGREMRVSDAELEALEWGGLLHDVGKIGVPDAVLLKQERLTREERMIMNAHPVLGAQIITPVLKLAAELPIILHHHEWFNGSGYPFRLIGDEIPKLARVLHVADAFEAMTAARPYRMTPLTAEQALGELRKFAGVQFDPIVVDAFVKTSWVEGVADAGQRPKPRPIPLIAQAAERMQASPPPEPAAAGPGSGASSGPA